MNRVKRAIHVLLFVCLILLASVGVGLSGGVPIPNLKNRRDPEKENIELVENQDDEIASRQDEVKG